MLIVAPRPKEYRELYAKCKPESTSFGDFDSLQHAWDACHLASCMGVIEEKSGAKRFGICYDEADQNPSYTGVFYRRGWKQSK